MDHFDEAKEALQTVQREFTATTSINASTTYTVVHACETAVRELYTIATSADFPYAQFQPHHVPEKLVTNLGLTEFYSPESQVFLAKMTGYGLQDARFENTTAFEQHTAEKSAARGKELLKGVTRFIEETQELVKNPAALQAIRSSKR